MTEPFSIASALIPASSQESTTESAIPGSQDVPAEDNSRIRRRGSHIQAKPSVLLQKIGLIGKEVVRILKSRNWEVCDPRALQENNIYYMPGGRAKGDEAKQGEDFFEGEGELYAFILESGGIQYLLPDANLSSEVTMDPMSKVEIASQKAFLQPTSEVDLLKIGAKTLEHSFISPTARENWDSVVGNSSKSISASAVSAQPKRKRSTKLFTAGAKPRSKAKSAQRLARKPRNKVIIQAPAKCQVIKELIPFVAANGCGQLAEFGAYEAALTARGWRAQLLQDVDLHLLRSVAAISRRQLALDAKSEDRKLFSAINYDKMVDSGVLQELQSVSSGIKASQNDLSSMIAAIIAQAERLRTFDRIECAARIGIPGFVSTGAGNLMLLRDIERHILLLVAALRQYLQARRIAYSEENIKPLDKFMKRGDLRALQLNIEKMNAELNELATIASTRVERKLLRLDSSTHMELDGDVETDSEQWLV